MTKAAFQVLVITTVVILLASCKTRQPISLNEAVVGMWNIDSVNESDEYLVCFVTNVVHFDQNMCKLPISNGVCDSLGAEDSGGIWNVSKSANEPYFLTVSSRNEFFTGKYQLIIEDDSTNHLMKMHLLSGRLDLLLRKWHVPYEQEQDLIRRLAVETSLPADTK